MDENNIQSMQMSSYDRYGADLFIHTHSKNNSNTILKLGNVRISIQKSSDLSLFKMLYFDQVITIPASQQLTYFTDYYFKRINRCNMTYPKNTHIQLFINKLGLWPTKRFIFGK